jgi:hypothetical protein
MLIYILVINLFLPVFSYNLCVVGGSSGLGKELIYQGTNERQLNVLALTSSVNPITVPCRKNDFKEMKNLEKFKHPYLTEDNYWKDISRHSYKNLVFATSAKPFEDDYSDKLMNKILNNLSDNCQSIHLVSLCNRNKINEWYLSDSYRAKKEQEKILKRYEKYLNVYIYRPSYLTYEENKPDSNTREKLANKILENCVYK